jgi:hypothetical protein
MSRLLVVLALLAAGCAPAEAYCYRPSPAEAVAGLFVAGLAAGVTLTEASHELPPPRPDKPRPTTPPLHGTVTAESGERVPHVTVTLRGSTGFVELETTTDERGRFLFPMPLPPDWYRVSVDEEQGTAETRVWLHRRHADLELQVQPPLVSTD